VARSEGRGAVAPRHASSHPARSRSGLNRLPGRIESAVFTGALLCYTVDVNGARLTDDLYDPRHAQVFHPGDAVTPALPDDLHVLPEFGVS
jgi:hypothetical protein